MQKNSSNLTGVNDLRKIDFNLTNNFKFRSRFKGKTIFEKNAFKDFNKLLKLNLNGVIFDNRFRCFLKTLNI